MNHSPGARRLEQRSITSLARGQECQIRLSGVCNFDPETTVPCHLRLAGISGIGFIAPPVFVAWGCSACHEFCTINHDDATKVAFYEGIFRTQAALLKAGVKAGWKQL